VGVYLLVWCGSWRNWGTKIEGVSPHVRTVQTASGARAVQIVYSRRAGHRQIEHIGSAHSDAQWELLKATAYQRLAAGQGELDLGLGIPGPGEALPITSTRMGYLWDALCAAYQGLGLDAATGYDQVFRDLVLARIIEPTSKLQALGVLDEAGIPTVSYATLRRRLGVYAQAAWRARVAKACAAHVGLGPATLILFDVTTLYFETDTGDGFREPGFSKERRLEPQITVGLLTDATGFPLMIEAFEGNQAETQAMMPVIKAFMKTHRLADVIIVADAGMISEANMRSIEKENLSFILGMKIPTMPYPVAKWRAENPGQDIPDGHVFTQPWPASPKDKRRDQVRYYQYSASRARRTLVGIDEQVRKAQAIINGDAPVKRNRFVTLTGATKTLNTDLAAKARALAGIKGYATNITCPTPEFVIGAYHRLYQIEKSFRMAKSDLAARPIYHHKKDSIDAHLTIVFTALAVARWLEATTGWSTKKLVTTLRRYRTIQIQVSGHTLTAVDPLPPQIHQLLATITTQARTPTPSQTTPSTNTSHISAGQTTHPTPAPQSAVDNHPSTVHTPQGH